MWGHMGSNDWEGGWGIMGFGMMGMTLFWILLVVALVLLIKTLWSSETKSGQKRETTALDILKERYARGEIDKTEFDQKKHDLGG
jgi:putative membrane protein